MKIFDITNSKNVKQFNNTYARACFHPKKRVRKKNYARARRMMGMPMPYMIGARLQSLKFRKIYKALKLSARKVDRK